MVDIGPVGRFLRNSGFISTSDDHIELFHSGTRDNPNINVLKCNLSGILFVDKIEKKVQDYTSRKSARESSQLPDNIRRKDEILPYAHEKVVVDIGAGSGGLVYALYPYCKKIEAVEPDPRFRNKLPCKFYGSVSELQNSTYDVAMLMHVLEHMERPLLELERIRTKLVPGGLLFVEVPHAGDLLIEICKEFRPFTFWADHLILHTKSSLEGLLRKAGYSSIHVRYHQRYGLNNHLHWLLRKSPGGHEKWQPINDDYYRNKIIRNGRSDTLFAIARSK